jgi:hypothetical protein
MLVVVRLYQNLSEVPFHQLLKKLTVRFNVKLSRIGSLRRSKRRNQRANASTKRTNVSPTSLRLNHLMTASRRLSEKTTPVPSFNVIEVLTASRTGERLSLLTVQAMVSSKEPKWTSVPVARDHEVEMTCGLDTGATHSIMSYKAAIRHKVLIVPSELRYKTADGVVHNMAGCTKELTVSVQGSVASLKFVVIDHKDNAIFWV